jgi:predicted dehydrogenase
MNKKIYKAALIGAGRIGMFHEQDPHRLKPATHFGMWRNHPKFDFVAVCDNDPAKCDVAKEWLPSLKTYTDPRQMLEETSPDTVAIATWRDTHFEMMNLALDFGVKVIICEKPIAEKTEDAVAIVKRCRDEGVELLINHRRRFDTLLYDLKKDIDNGMIGEIVQGSSYYVYGLLTTGTHAVDALRFLLSDVAGDVAWVSAFPNTLEAFSPPDDPCVDAILGFENGLKVSLQSLNIQDYDLFQFDFYGRKGKISLRNIGRDIDIHRVIDSPEHEGFTELENQPSETRGGDPRGQFLFMADNVFDCLEGEATSLSTGEDSLKALDILLKMRESAADNGRVIQID